jgi:hypothetical protein
LTPAARTRISTSPGRGAGTGPLASRITSGPPAPSVAICVIVSGRVIGGIPG